MKSKNFLAFFLLLPFFVVLPASAFRPEFQAQDATPTPYISDDQVNVIARQMYCPVCENTPLDVCPTQACAEWRELIREKLAQGWNEGQIKDYFVEQFGDRVLATPPARGINWLVYVIPPIAFLMGMLILYQALRSWRRPASASSGGPVDAAQVETPAAQDEYIKRLEQELRSKQR